MKGRTTISTPSRKNRVRESLPPKSSITGDRFTTQSLNCDNQTITPAYNLIRSSHMTCKRSAGQINGR